MTDGSDAIQGTVVPFRVYDAHLKLAIHQPFDESCREGGLAGARWPRDEDVLTVRLKRDRPVRVGCQDDDISAAPGGTAREIIRHDLLDQLYDALPLGAPRAEIGSCLGTGDGVVHCDRTLADLEKGLI